MVDRRRDPWWSSGDERDLWADALSVYQSLAWRRARWETALALCLEQRVTSLRPGDQQFADLIGDDWEPLSINAVESVVETLHSRLGATQIKPQIVTSGAGYEQRRAAQRADEFIQGAFYSGRVWSDVAPDVLHDILRFGTGIATSWVEEGELVFERVRPWELLVDDVDGAERRPRTVYRVRWVDRALAAARWPDEAATIEAAPAPSGDWALVDTGARTDVIVVVEGWHLPSGAGAGDGRHTLAVQGALIADEEWTESRFPFAVGRYQREPIGWYGRGVPDQLVGLQYDINATLLTIRDCHRFAGMQIFVERGSRVVKTHLGNEVGAIVEFDGRPPQFFTPQTVHPEQYNWLATQYQRCFERAGVSQLASQAQIPAGLSGASGKALRTYVAEADSRFTAVLRDFEDWHCDLARVAIMALRHAGESVSVISRGKGSIREVRWREVKLEEPYVVQVLPSSMLPQTVAGRLEAVRDLINDGLADALKLDPETIQRLLNWPDLESEGLTAGRDAVDEVISAMLDSGTPGVPDSTLDLNVCVAQGIRRYAILVRDGEDVDSERLALLRQWIDSARSMLEQAMPEEPAAAPPVPEEVLQ